jgi:hypothetical protein
MKKEKRKATSDKIMKRKENILAVVVKLGMVCYDWQLV